MKLFLPWELDSALATADLRSLGLIRNNAQNIAALKVLELPIPIDVIRLQLGFKVPHPDTVMQLADSRGAKYLHDVDEVRAGDDKKPNGYDERLAQLLATTGGIT